MQKVKLTLFILPLILGLEGLTFAQSLHHQTLSAMGSQSFSLTSGLLVQQSIGQSSVTGTFNSSTAYLSQGFLKGLPSLSKETELPFDVIAFPNAFDNQIRFRFTSDPNIPTQVRIHDSQGKMVYEQLHLPKNQEIEVQLAHLAPGIYLVDLHTDRRSTQVRILKNR
uniref:T9SS type A sorting domain-containing protein n=1 Tax=Algoriphagus sp. TaxID=1872435 RepID=UPI00404825A4